MARAAVILNVEPNTLGGGDFRVKRDPVAPGGAFVYDPRDVFATFIHPGSKKGFMSESGRV